MFNFKQLHYFSYEYNQEFLKIQYMKYNIEKLKKSVFESIKRNNQIGQEL
jgi:hypothetical protein